MFIQIHQVALTYVNAFQRVAYIALYQPTPEKYQVLKLFVKYGADASKTKFRYFHNNSKDNIYSIMNFPIFEAFKFDKNELPYLKR